MQHIRKLHLVLPEDSAIPLLGIFSEDGVTGNKDTCSTMFIEALFMIVRRWKETMSLNRVDIENVVLSDLKQ